MHLYGNIFFIQIPLRHTQEPANTTNSKKSKGGRPEDTEQLKALEKSSIYFELHEDEQLTLLGLVDIMQKSLESSDKSAYTKVHFKRKLLENYCDKLVILNKGGKPDIPTLKSSVNTILRKTMKHQKILVYIYRKYYL